MNLKVNIEHLLLVLTKHDLDPYQKPDMSILNRENRLEE